MDPVVVAEAGGELIKGALIDANVVARTTCNSRFHLNLAGPRPITFLHRVPAARKDAGDESPRL
jgi:hypothetical protein